MVERALLKLSYKTQSLSHGSYQVYISVQWWWWYIAHRQVEVDIDQKVYSIYTSSVALYIWCFMMTLLIEKDELWTTEGDLRCNGRCK